MSLYRVVLILSILAALVYAAAAVVSGSPQGLGIPSQTNFQPGTNPASTTPNGALLGYAALAGLLALVNLILIIISWLRWRSAVKDLMASAAEYGPAHSQEAAAARRDYGYTVWTFIIFILVVIGVAIAAAAIVASTIISGFGPNATGTLSQAQANHLRAELLGVIAFSLIAGGLFQFLQYFFASRSLKGSFYSLANPEQRALLDRGRSLVLVGAVLGFGSGLALITPYGQFIAVLSPLFILFGFFSFLNAYDQWLVQPHPAPAAPAPPFPPAPTQFR